MNAKILLIAFSAAAFSSCSTAYKSGQTPDDVYYSPVRMVDETRNNKRDETTTQQSSPDEARIRMQIRDHRWRDLDNDYDYGYNYSPYYYSCYGYNNYGYYYNPYYCSRPLYYPNVVAVSPINHTPRMVNLNTYKNYAVATATNPKTGVTTTQTTSRQYNNSNNSSSRFGNILRQVFTPNPNTNSYTPSSSNNSRTYSPSTPSSSGSSGSSSGGSSSGGSVSRPGRG